MTSALLTDVVGGSPDDVDNLDLFAAYGDHIMLTERGRNEATDESVRLALVGPLKTLEAFGEVLDRIAFVPEEFLS